MEEYKNPIDLNTAAEMIGVSRNTVIEIIRMGRIRAYRVGAKQAIRIPKLEVKNYIKHCEIFAGDL